MNGFSPGGSATARQQPRLADAVPRGGLERHRQHGMGRGGRRAVPHSKTSNIVAVRDVESQPQTQIVDFTTTGKGSPLPR